MLGTHAWGPATEPGATEQKNLCVCARLDQVEAEGPGPGQRVSEWPVPLLS